MTITKGTTFSAAVGDSCVEFTTVKRLGTEAWKCESEDGHVQAFLTEDIERRIKRAAYLRSTGAVRKPLIEIPPVPSLDELRAREGGSR
jgi:hypothetical protein